MHQGQTAGYSNSCGSCCQCVLCATYQLVSARLWTACIVLVVDINCYPRGTSLEACGPHDWVCMVGAKCISQRCTANSTPGLVWLVAS